MCEQGHGITFAGDPGTRESLLGEQDWPWLDVSFKCSPFKIRHKFRALRAYLIEQRVDLLHTHCRWSTLIARVASKGMGLPVLHTVHTAGWPVYWQNRWLCDFGDYTHAASEWSQRWLVEMAGVLPQRISTIPHGVVVEDFPVASEAQKQQARAELGLSKNAIVAAYVGCLEPHKNIEWMLDLAQTPQQRLPGLRVLIVGRGGLEQKIRHRIKQEGLSQRVLLLDRCDPLMAYQACDAFFLPSGLEGFSYVCAEAMATGRPVLRTRTAGVTEQIVEGVTGRSAPIERTTFVQSAIRLLSERSALVEMGEAAAQQVREKLTFEQQLTDTLALYRKLIGTYHRHRVGPSPSLSASASWVAIHNASIRSRRSTDQAPDHPVGEMEEVGVVDRPIDVG